MSELTRLQARAKKGLLNDPVTEQISSTNSVDNILDTVSEKTHSPDTLLPEQDFPAPERVNKMTDTCNRQFVDEFSLAAKDRADQDRYLAAEFSRTNGNVKDAIASLSTDVERNGRSSELATEKTAAAINLAVEKTGAAGALAAAMNAAALQAKIAECCCETQRTIAEDGQKTRDLINSLQALNNAVQLVDAKNEVLALRLGAKAA